MNDETMREAFEKWMRTCEGHPFAGQFANLMWKAWQAAWSRAQASAPEGATNRDEISSKLVDAPEGETFIGKWRKAINATMPCNGCGYLACDDCFERHAQEQGYTRSNAKAGEVSAWVGDMKTSAGMDYYVCVGHSKAFGGYLTPNVYKVRGRAEYDVAEWNHMLGLGPKPDILALDTDQTLSTQRGDGSEMGVGS